MFLVDNVILSMNLIRTLGDLVFGKQDEVLVQIPSGQFYYLDPSHPSMTKKLLYRTSSLSIKRTGTRYQYQLIASNRDEDDDVLDIETSFLVDSCLCFRLVTSNDRSSPRLIWADINDDTGTCGYEFLTDADCPQVTLQLFEEALFSCMYERTHQLAHDQVSHQELASYMSELRDLGLTSNVGIWKKVECIKLDHGNA